MAADLKALVRPLWKHLDSGMLSSADGAIQPGTASPGDFAAYNPSSFAIDPALLTDPMLKTGSAMAQSAGPVGTNAPNSAAAPLSDTFSALNASGLGITVEFDIGGTNSSAPAGFQSSVEAAVQYFESHFVVDNPVNLTLHVGYGEIGGWGGSSGTPLGPSELGRSQSVSHFWFYDQVKSALQARSATPDEVAAYNSLPATDPVGNSNSNYFFADAEAQALGLESSAGTTNGSIGFGNGDPVTWGTTNQATTNTYDGFALIEHELSEVLGRTGNVGAGFTPSWTTLDLFRYSSAGVRQLGSGPGYFSLDNGTTDLGAFNDPAGVNGGDAGDWDNSVTNDAFDAFTGGGAPAPVSALDNRVMDVLGYQPIACFAAGTRIRTAQGEVPVEQLQAGTQALCADGSGAPVRWIGYRRIDCRRHAEPDRVRPIRVAAGAFGPDAPRRDLLLSPDHAVMLDGYLVPIRLLVNFASIAPVTRCRTVMYFHVELDRHGVLVANGLPAESYLDTGNRAMFENHGGALQLHPLLEDATGQARRVAESCLPLATDPAWLEPRWRALAQRADALGYQRPRVETTDDPALSLVIGKTRLRPVWREDCRYGFVVPPGSEPVRLVSRSAVPSSVQPWMEDRRRLGVMLHGLTIRKGDTRIYINPANPGLCDGWWPAERHGDAIWRWTQGDARLPAVCRDAMMEIRIGVPGMGYPLHATNGGVQTRRRAAKA